MVFNNKRHATINLQWNPFNKGTHTESRDTYRPTDRVVAIFTVRLYAAISQNAIISICWSWINKCYVPVESSHQDSFNKLSYMSRDQVITAARRQDGRVRPPATEVNRAGALLAIHRMRAFVPTGNLTAWTCWVHYNCQSGEICDQRYRGFKRTRLKRFKASSVSQRSIF